MNSDFEYITYLDDEWPDAYENQGVEAPPRAARPAVTRTGAARPGMAGRPAAHTGARRTRGFLGGFPRAATPPDGFSDGEVAEEELSEEGTPRGGRSASRWAGAGGRTAVLIAPGRRPARQR